MQVKGDNMFNEKKKYNGLLFEITLFNGYNVLSGSAFSAGDWDDEGFDGPSW